MKILYLNKCTILLLAGVFSWSDARLREHFLTRPSEEELGAMGGSNMAKTPVQETCKNYKMRFAGTNFVHENHNILEGYNWGVHALTWKGLIHKTDNHCGAYNKAALSAADAPAKNSGLGGYPQTANMVSCHGAARLNDLESVSSEIFSTNGVFKNPTGTWACERGEDNAKAGAVLAAMHMYKWATPTYLDMKSADGGIVGMVVKQVRLCAEGKDPPDVICDWNRNGGACDIDLLSLQNIEVAVFFSNGKYATTNPLDADGWELQYGNFKTDVTPELVFCVGH